MKKYLAIVFALTLSPNAFAQEMHIDPLFPKTPDIFHAICVDEFPADVMCDGAPAMCFVAGTLIEVAGTGTLPIEQLKPGMLVDSVTPKELFVKTLPSAFQAAIDKVSAQNAEHPIAVLTLNDGTVLKGTANHPIGTPKGFVAMGKLKPSDVVLTKHGTEKVKTLGFEAYSGMVYNFAVNTTAGGASSQTPTGNYYANGVLVGDLNVQNALN